MLPGGMGEGEKLQTRERPGVINRVKSLWRSGGHIAGRGLALNTKESTVYYYRKDRKKVEEDAGKNLREEAES